MSSLLSRFILESERLRRLGGQGKKAEESLNKKDRLKDKLFEKLYVEEQQKDLIISKNFINYI